MSDLTKTKGAAGLSAAPGSAPSIHYAETRYGFDWGAAQIERCFSDHRRGWVTLRVITKKHDLQIYVTKSGKVRVHDALGEWKPNNR
jgi:hypothetical protein